MTDIEQNIRTSVAQMLPEFIERHPGCTQEQLANRLGISRKTLYIYRQDPSYLTPYTLRKMLFNMRQLDIPFETQKSE